MTNVSKSYSKSMSVSVPRLERTERAAYYVTVEKALCLLDQFIGIRRLIFAEITGRVNPLRD